MQTQFLRRPEGKIAYEVNGSGPLVVAVPSMGDLRAEYRFLSPKLQAAGFRVAVMDVRGHGESTTQWSDFSVAGVGSDILALIRELGNQPAFVVGDSMAAGASVWAAAEAPDCIRSMVLLGPFVRNVGANGFMNTLIKVMFAEPWGSIMWGMYYNGLYPTNKPADMPSYLSKLKANLREPGRLSALNKMLAASKSESEARLPRVQAPVLVLMGSRDPDFKQPQAEAAWVAQQLHGTYQIIEGAGHYPHAEMPDTVAPLVIDFFQSLGKDKANGA